MNKPEPILNRINPVIIANAEDTALRKYAKLINTEAVKKANQQLS